MLSIDVRAAVNLFPVPLVGQSTQENIMMKHARATTLLATLFALGAPLAAHAQSTNSPVTRAEVNADLARVEQAGYDPHANKQNYPADIQAAENRVNPVSANANSDYGPGIGGTTASGNRAMPISVQSNGIYQHH
ncbi:hypothetical protein PBS_35000 [Paraburkholderia sp. 2C]